jgi:hypothetical protein
MMVNAWCALPLGYFVFSMSLMTTNRTSATNCARIYNTDATHEHVRKSLPTVWATRLQLDCRDIWNGFFLNSLLIDCLERSTYLELPHNAPSQEVRFRDALRARNLRMAGTGQDEWNHACDLCCWVEMGEDGVESTLLPFSAHVQCLILTQGNFVQLSRME